MATADVIALQTATAFENASAFLNTDKAVVTAGLPPNGPTQDPAPSNSAVVQVEVDRFPLEDTSFENLQIYLKAALKLPKDGKNFEQVYPQVIFAHYTDKDTATPKLYDFLRDTLTDIHQHFFDFQVGPMNSMMILAGEIANFSCQTSQGVAGIAGNFDLILVPGANFSDDEIRTAADDISNAVETLKEKATATKARCHETFLALSKFKVITGVDKEDLEKVASRSAMVLPSTNDLNDEMRKRADAAYTALNNLARHENAILQKIEHKSGAKWYYFIPWIGVGLAVADTASRFTAEKDLVAARRQYESIFASTSETLRTAIMFRGICKHLNDSIKEVTEAIKNAEDALQGMMYAFSNLEVGLGSIADDLDSAKGKVTEQVARRRRAAMDALKRAEKMWIKVSDLATRFQAKGIVLEKDVNQLPDDPAPDPWLDLVAANYGGVDVSDYAQVLFNYGDSIRIRSVEPGFPESWKGVTKSISVLHRLNASQRMFLCREYTGKNFVHILELKKKKKKNFSDQQLVDAELNELNPLSTSGGSSPIQILAIVWGPKEVRAQSVWDYCYSKINNGDVQWSNNTMGGDTWHGVQKSGVIYYQRKGSTTVRQCTGREYTSTLFFAN